jgi:Mg-chelatase subunit ChlI
MITAALIRQAVFLILAIPFSDLARSADLDAPVKQSAPTIRSEIFRGRTATDVCPISDTKLIDECANRLQSKAITERTTSDAFELGVFYNAALLSAANAKVTGSPASAEVTVRILRKVRALEGKLGLTDEQVCQAAQIHDCNVAREVIRSVSTAK